MPTKHQEISEEHHEEINSSILEWSLAGVLAVWHRATLNEKCEGEILSIPFTENHPECILDVQHAGSLDSS